MACREGKGRGQGMWLPQDRGAPGMSWTLTLSVWLAWVVQLTRSCARHLHRGERQHAHKAFLMIHTLQQDGQEGLMASAC